jgi:hypothetical protein
MSTPHDPQASPEATLLARTFQAHAALSPAQIEYLRLRGFLPETSGRDHDYSDEEDYSDWRAAEDDAEDLDEAGDRAAQRQGRGRSECTAPEWSLADLGKYLGTLLERQRDHLLPLTHLAPEADTFGEALATLRKLDTDTLATRLSAALTSRWFTLYDLWATLTLDTFRRPFDASGPAYRGYLALIRATDLNQLPGKYTWVLRQEEIQTIQQFLCVQRALLRAAGHLWRESPAVVSRHLRRAPHRLALLAHILLFNSHPAGSPARAWTAREEPFASLPPHEHADAYRRAWTLAVQMDPDAILPYLVEFFTPPAESSPPRLFCPAGWCELGFRAREPGP